VLSKKIVEIAIEAFAHVMGAGGVGGKCLDFQTIGSLQMSAGNLCFLVHCLLLKKISSGGEGKIWAERR